MIRDLESLDNGTYKANMKKLIDATESLVASTNHLCKVIEKLVQNMPDEKRDDRAKRV